MKKVISVNVAVLGSFSETRTNLAKWNGNQIHTSWAYRNSEIQRMLGFGSVGRKVITEDIAKTLEIDYTTAKEILQEIEKSI